MARRNPNPVLNPVRDPSPRTLLVLVFLTPVTVAWAGREHLATLDAGVRWGPSGAACTATGPLAGVLASAAPDAVACAPMARLDAKGGDAAAAFALPERLALRFTR